MKKTPLKRKTPLRSTPSKCKVEKKEVKKKEKKTPKRKLIEQLDTIFSRYIRLKYSNSQGICECISCGKRQYWRDIQNGHYMSRRFYSTRWSEDNCRPQCAGCNIFNQGNIQAYRVALIKQIGEQRVNLVEARARQEHCKYGEFELNAMIQHYTKELKDLCKEKGIEL